MGQNLTALRLDRPIAAQAIEGVYSQGFDSVTGKILTKKCVKVTSLQAKAGTVVAGSGEHVFHEATSLEEIRTDTKTSASASLLYEGFSASVGGSVVNGSFSSSFGRYVTAYQEIITNEYEARGNGDNGDVQLTKSALAGWKKRFGHLVVIFSYPVTNRAAFLMSSPRSKPT